ncbi:MAG: hypothetical protein OXD33_09335 [Rhodobacteraceae bacterium]|nr:hypothetical protein [Paracoccaceae bacterium]
MRSVSCISVRYDVNLLQRTGSVMDMENVLGGGVPVDELRTIGGLTHDIWPVGRHLRVRGLSLIDKGFAGRGVR